MGRPLESLLKHYQLPNFSQRKREQEKRWQNTDVHGLTHPFAAYLWILIPKLLKLRMELTLLLVYQTNNIAWIFRIVFQQKTCNYKELLSSLHRLVGLALESESAARIFKLSTLILQFKGNCFTRKFFQVHLLCFNEKYFGKCGKCILLLNFEIRHFPILFVRRGFLGRLW